MGNMNKSTKYKQLRTKNWSFSKNDRKNQRLVNQDNRNRDKVNTLDLGHHSVNDVEKLLRFYIHKSIDNHDLPLRIITHNIVEKEIILRKIKDEMKLDIFITNEENMGCFTLIGQKK